VADSHDAVAAATARLALRAEARTFGVDLGDGSLLLRDGGLRGLELLHDHELRVFEVALALRERYELVLEPLRLLGVARRGEPLRVARRRASTSATSDSRRSSSARASSRSPRRPVSTADCAWRSSSSLTRAL
jgi:hypothetical protein